MLQRSVETVTPGSQVRAGKAPEGEFRSVRSAADRFRIGSNAQLLHDLFRRIDQVHAGPDLLLHIAVLAADPQADRARTVFFIQGLFDQLQAFEPCLKMGSGVIYRRIFQTVFASNSSRRFL